MTLLDLISSTRSPIRRSSYTWTEPADTLGLSSRGDMSAKTAIPTASQNILKISHPPPAALMPLESKLTPSHEPKPATARNMMPPASLVRGVTFRIAIRVSCKWAAGTAARAGSDTTAFSCARRSLAQDRCEAGSSQTHRRAKAVLRCPLLEGGGCARAPRSPPPRPRRHLRDPNAGDPIQYDELRNRRPCGARMGAG